VALHRRRARHAARLLAALVTATDACDEHTRAGARVTGTAALRRRCRCRTPRCAAPAAAARPRRSRTAGGKAALGGGSHARRRRGPPRWRRLIPSAPSVSRACGVSAAVRWPEAAGVVRHGAAAAGDAARRQR
jgi:hypothetical protein